MLIGDAVDRGGERTDEIIDCPQCTSDDFEEIEPEDLAPLEKWWPTEPSSER